MFHVNTARGLTALGTGSMSPVLGGPSAMCSRLSLKGPLFGLKSIGNARLDQTRGPSSQDLVSDSGQNQLLQEKTQEMP